MTRIRGYVIVAVAASSAVPQLLYRRYVDPPGAFWLTSYNLAAVLWLVVVFACARLISRKTAWRLLLAPIAFWPSIRMWLLWLSFRAGTSP
jgi:hypothetical protein